MKTFCFFILYGVFFSFLFAEDVSFLLEQKQIWKDKKGSVHFCTVGCYPGQDPYIHMFRLFESAKRYGISITHLGKEATSWGGIVTKPIWFYEYIKTLPDEDIVICVDACDVFFCASEKEIIKKFHKMDALIAFSTERNCYPCLELKPFFYSRTRSSSFKYLNAGGFIGYAGALKFMLQEIISQIHPGVPCDQNLCLNYYVKRPNLIYLDTSCQIFCSLFEVDLYEIRKKQDRIFLKETRSYPCIIHGNGDKGKPPFMKLYDSLLP